MNTRTAILMSILSAIACLALLSCSVGHGVGGLGGTKPPPVAGGEFAIVNWLAGISLAIGTAMFIASFWVPLIPIKGAGACVVAAIGLWALRYALEKYLHPAVNVLMIVAGIAAAVALFPIVHTWVNAHLAGMAKKVEATNPEAADVLREIAKGDTKLLGRLKSLTEPSAVAPAPVDGAKT